MRIVYIMYNNNIMFVVYELVSFKIVTDDELRKYVRFSMNNVCIFYSNVVFGI